MLLSGGALLAAEVIAVLLPASLVPRPERHLRTRMAFSFCARETKEPRRFLAEPSLVLRSSG